MGKYTAHTDKIQINSTEKVYNYSEFNKDKNYIINLLYDSWGLSFNGLKCVETDSIAIHKRTNGEWWVKKFNDTKFPGLPIYANFEGLVYALTHHIADGKERAGKQGEIIARCNAQILPQTNVLAKTNTNPHKEENKGLNVEFGDLTTEALDYFKEKGGISKGTLERYGVKTAVKLWGRKEYYLSVGWVVGDNTKVKRTKHPSKKYAQKFGEKPYIFGLEQLPKAGETLIICAGETDCLCINEHGNKQGVWAICLRSENDLNTLTDSQINDLKARFGAIYVFYDADETGYKYGKELALKTGFVWVNSLLFASWGNDVCEMWQRGCGVLHLVNHFTNTLKHTRINAVPTDKFSIDVPFVYELNFNQYLGESNPLETIKDLLSIDKRLAIQSAAGTGKSTMILELCRKNSSGENFVKERLKLPKTIVATPTTAIGLQLQKDFAKKGVSVSIVYGEIKGEDLEAGRHDTLVITTYDSIKHLSEFIPNCLLIVDEFHQIANDYDYRKNAMFSVWDGMLKAPNVLLLSATPNQLFCSHLAPFFNYSLVLGIPQTTNKINVRFLEHSVSKKYLNDYIEENAPRSGTICVKYDSNTTLETYYKSDIERGLNVEHFTSKERARKEANDNYNAIMETGEPVQPLERLYFTTLLEAGVSLKFAVSLVAIFDVKSWSKIIQLSTRPRLHQKNGVWVNDLVDVWVFTSKNRKDEPAQNPQTAKERWLNYYAGALGIANHFNGARMGTIDHTTTNDFKNFCSVNDGLWCVNVPAILHEIFKQETSETDIQTLIGRITRFDKRFSIEYTGEISTGENADLLAALEQAKADKEKAQSTLWELLKTQPITALHALCKLVRDKELKADAKRVLGLPIANKEAVTELIKSKAPAFNTGDNNRILKDLVFLVGELGDGVQTAIQKIALKSKKELLLERNTHQRKERIKTYKTAPTEQSPKARLEVERERAICKKIAKVLDNVRQGRRKNEFTAVELAKLVNDALGGLVVDGKAIVTPKKIGVKGVVGYLSEFYEIERGQKGEKDERIYFYRIIKSKKLG